MAFSFAPGPQPNTIVLTGSKMTPGNTVTFSLGATGAAVGAHAAPVVDANGNLSATIPVADAKLLMISCEWYDDGDGPFTGAGGSDGVTTIGQTMTVQAAAVPS